MNALLLETVGGADPGNASGSSARFEVHARSREYLRRGLLLSGAIHVVLLLAFLRLHGGGDDVLLRSYDRAVDVFREPPAIAIPLPPAPPGAPSTTASQTGTVIPVDVTTLPIPDFPGVGVLDPPPGSVPSGGGPSNSGDTGGPPPAAPDPNQVFLIKDVDVPPVPIDAPKPIYPQIARDAGITGRVLVEVLVKADGTVGRAWVKSGNKILGDAAQEGLVRWRFRPAMAHGRPVAVWVEIPVNFTQ